MKAKNKPADYKILILLCSITIVAFLFTFRCIYPVDYGNLGGKDIWLSGSTIKFVNMWLEEGASTNRFTCYESFDSIEFNSLQERTPYLSYPTGTVFMVFAAAKCAGRSHIDVSFLKHFQMCLFLLEVLFFEIFLYLWLSNAGVRSKGIKAFIAFTLSAMWMLLPGSVYYLPNVFYADQAVIFWFMFFILIEYISNVCNVGKIPSFGILLGKAFIIYIGVLTDYYFWLLVFWAFFFQFVRDMLLKRRFLKCVKNSLWYVCPVFLALATYLWQLSYTENWSAALLDKFMIRTEGGKFSVIVNYFCRLYLMDSRIRLTLLLGVVAVIILSSVYFILKNKKWKEIFLNYNISIIVVGVLATFMQLAVLNNHSGSHQFSMIKMGWIITVSVLAGTMIWAVNGTQGIETEWKRSTHKISALLGKYIIVIVAFNLITGSVLSTNFFMDKAVFKYTYELEKVLYKIREYRQVYYCFTYEITTIPPYQLSVSEKEVHLIQNFDEVDELFPNLSADAQKVLIIDKLCAPKAEEIADMEAEALAHNKVIYEDDIYCMVELENY